MLIYLFKIGFNVKETVVPEKPGFFALHSVHPDTLFELSKSTIDFFKFLP